MVARTRQDAGSCNSVPVPLSVVLRFIVLRFMEPTSSSNIDCMQPCIRLAIASIVILLSGTARSQPAGETYLGFDRNTYPGDANLKALHQTFSYTGYWLNNPPGEKTNTWTGHRAAVESAGFGFLVLFNGRLYAELKSSGNAASLGRSDG